LQYHDCYRMLFVASSEMLLMQSRSGMMRST
jgi:hypothetical protein